ncbi:Uncharacterised protein [Mycobacterium tuberculosis]|nr:Uncharacterised protein [Mycobacterium tuberculosis]
MDSISFFLVFLEGFLDFFSGDFLLMLLLSKSLKIFLKIF